MAFTDEEIARYARQGHAGLGDRSRRPHSSPKRTPAAIELDILRIRAESNNAWGGRKIARVMVGDGAARVGADAAVALHVGLKNGRLVQGHVGNPVELLQDADGRPGVEQVLVEVQPDAE